MNLFDSSGSPLLQAFSLAGQRLAVVYDLSGSILWTGDAVDKTFSGSHKTWQFRPEGGDWQTVTIPHDWSIYNDFNPDSPSTYEGGYLDGGEADYQTSFEVPAALKTKRTLLYFDGVYMESTVTLNSHVLGRNHNGYNPFWFDVTDKLTEGINVLTVHVVNRQPSSRWYSGSGIYRPVYLLGTETADFAVDELKVTAPGLNSVPDQSTVIRTVVTGKLYNFGAAGSKAIKVVVRKGSTEVGTTTATVTLAAGANDLSLTVDVAGPDLWDIGKPNLYTAAVLVDGVEVGSTVFGYRRRCRHLHPAGQRGQGHRHDPANHDRRELPEKRRRRLPCRLHGGGGHCGHQLQRQRPECAARTREALLRIRWTSARMILCL